MQIVDAVDDVALPAMRMECSLNWNALIVGYASPSSAFRFAAFWATSDGLLSRGVEYWITVGDDVPGPR